MKQSIFFLLTLLLSFTLRANTELKTVVKDLNGVIEQLNFINSQSEATTTPPPFLWETADEKEAQFWTSVKKAHEFLMAHGIKERHSFMFNLTRAMTKTVYNERMAALKAWIESEEKRMGALHSNYVFYSEWKNLFSAVREATERLESARSNSQTVRTPLFSLDQTIQNLRSIQGIIEEQVNHSNTVSTTFVADTQEARGNTNQNESFSFNDTFLFGIAALLSLTLFLIDRKRGPKTVPDTAVINQPESEPPIFVSLPVMPSGSSLEESCRNMLEANKYLFDISNLKVHPRAASPFTTTIMAPQEKINAAIVGLLKGTLAIANNNGTQIPSFIEWGCQTYKGRISLEFTIHGIECDAQYLYMNTLLEGDGSAPAHFGRAEQCLSTHLANVGVRTHNKRTTIYLGLDAHHVNDYRESSMTN